jgi:L-asparaginase / beta-aspartyl-peptidase
MIEYGIVVHGGAGAPESLSGGCAAACSAGFALLKAGSSAVDAVTEAVRTMEDDGRFNAGTGSVLRLDGKTREMDAAVMDSKKNLGIVISLKNFRNPVLVARAVMDTPHVALSGNGAANYARMRGFGLIDFIPEAVLERCVKIRRIMESPEALGKEYPAWKSRDLRTLWNFDEPPPEDLLLCETVGAVAIDKRGLLAVAGSTGGASPMLMGRVGDTAMAGCGFLAGPAAAIAVTGLGEEMIRNMTAKTVYDYVAGGETIEEACAKVTAIFPLHVPVGIIGISRMGCSISANRPLPHHLLVSPA